MLSFSSRVHEHLRSNVAGYLAVFIALGGTTWAAAEIGSKDIRKGAVKAKQIQDGAVTGPKLAAGSVGTAAVADGAITAEDIKLSTFNFGALQLRVSGSCAAGEAIRQVNVDGTVACEQTNAADPPLDQAHGIAPNQNSPTSDPCDTGQTAIFCGVGDNGWQDGAAPVHFLKDRDGYVHLEGQAQVFGFGRTNIFILPPSHRPAVPRMYAVPCETGQTSPAWAIGRVEIAPSGAVSIAASPDCGEGRLLSLDGIDFRAGV